jgi:hypothetical protein
MNKSMKSKILIIGAGQLGSRHLQGLAKINRALDLYIYDPSPASLRVAKERFESINPRSNITLSILSDIKCAPNEIDLTIVATTSDKRLQVIKTVLSLIDVKYFLLEKVLFQNLDDYYEAPLVLGQSGCKTWVNCAQRLWPFFKDLRDKYANDPDLRITFSGSNWGLGCNSVHNIDIANYIWAGKRKHIAILDKTVLDSKRIGFKEFSGEITTKIDSGGELRQISYSIGNAPFIVSVDHPTERVVWDITNNRLSIKNELTGWESVESFMQAPFQSELTTDIACNILDGIDCGLPDFKTSVDIHLETLSTLITGMRCKGIDYGRILPIT